MFEGSSCDVNMFWLILYFLVNENTKFDQFFSLPKTEFFLPRWGAAVPICKEIKNTQKAEKRV